MNVMLKLLGKSNAVDKISIKAFRNKIKWRATIAKFVMVIVYDRDRIRMSLWYGEVMNNIWQLLEGKTDKELSIKAALRELEEETGLVAEPEDLKFFLNNPNYNCDVYTLKVHLNTELNLIKSNKNGK